MVTWNKFLNKNPVSLHSTADTAETSMGEGPMETSSEAEEEGAPLVPFPFPFSSLGFMKSASRRLRAELPSEGRLGFTGAFLLFLGSC